MLPLSVLAWKTHNLSKTAEVFTKDAKPVLENVGKAAKGVEEVANGVKPVVNDLQSASAATKETAIGLRDAVNETTAVIKSEELKGLINELTSKTKNINLGNEVSKICDSVCGKIGEVDPIAIKNLLNKVNELDVKVLSDNAIEILKKIQNFKISIG